MEIPMNEKGYVLGADFGSDSVRAVIVSLADGSVPMAHISCRRKEFSGSIRLIISNLWKRLSQRRLGRLETEYERQDAELR